MEENHPFRIAIAGQDGHGKRTVARTLVEHADVKYVDWKEGAARLCVMDSPQFKGRYPTIEACVADYPNYVREWRRAINIFNHGLNYRLCLSLFQEYDICLDLRDAFELRSLRSIDLPDVLLWVDGNTRVGYVETHDLTIREEDADVVIDNNGTIEMLRSEIRRLVINLHLPLWPTARNSIEDTG